MHCGQLTPQLQGRSDDCQLTGDIWQNTVPAIPDVVLAASDRWTLVKSSLNTSFCYIVIIVLFIAALKQIVLYKSSTVVKTVKKIPFCQFKFHSMPFGQFHIRVPTWNTYSK